MCTCLFFRLVYIRDTRKSTDMYPRFTLIRLCIICYKSELIISRSSLLLIIVFLQDKGCVCVCVRGQEVDARFTHCDNVKL